MQAAVETIVCQIRGAGEVKREDVLDGSDVRCCDM